MKIAGIIIFIIGLIYVLLPGPSDIKDFPQLPGSTVSQLEGDTIQNPNIVGYFSDFKRADITKFYRQAYNAGLFGIPSIRYNHPPEDARVFVRDQQESTFLEEYIHPLRDSIYVNGYEPAVENAMFHKETDFIGDHLHYGDAYFNSKTTLRFYPTKWWIRLTNYLLVWLAIVALYKLTRRALREAA